MQGRQCACESRSFYGCQKGCLKNSCLRQQNPSAYRWQGIRPGSCPMGATGDSATGCFVTSGARLFCRYKCHDEGLQVSGHDYVRTLRQTRDFSWLGEHRKLRLHALHSLRNVLQQDPIPFRASLCLFYSVTNDVPYKMEPSSGKAGDVLVVK